MPAAACYPPVSCSAATYLLEPGALVDLFELHIQAMGRVLVHAIQAMGRVLPTPRLSEGTVVPGLPAWQGVLTA